MVILIKNSSVFIINYSYIIKPLNNSQIFHNIYGISTETLWVRYTYSFFVS